MRFLVDAQLLPALARMLADQGHEAEHVVDIGPGDASDGELWQYALDNHAVIITKDEDFTDIAAVRSPAPVIVSDIRTNVGEDVVDDLRTGLKNGTELLRIDLLCDLRAGVASQPVRGPDGSICPDR